MHPALGVATTLLVVVIDFLLVWRLASMRNCLIKS
jgi:hypothetical protein